MRVLTLPVIDAEAEAEFIRKTNVLEGKDVPLHDYYGHDLGSKFIAMTVLKKCFSEMVVRKITNLKAMQPLIIRQATAVLEILGAPTAEVSFWHIRRSTTMHPAHQALAAILALHVRFAVVHNLPNRHDPQDAKNDHRMSEAAPENRDRATCLTIRQSQDSAAQVDPAGRTAYDEAQTKTQMEEDKLKVNTDVAVKTEKPAAVKTQKHASDTNEMKDSCDNQAEAGPSHEMGKERISKNDAAVQETSATEMQDHPAFEDIRDKKRKRDVLCKADPTPNKARSVNVSFFIYI